MNRGQNAVVPFQQYRFYYSNGKPIDNDVEQWFQQGIQVEKKSTGQFCSTKTCCYIFASVLCGIVVFTAILVPVLWKVFNPTTTEPTTTTTASPSVVYLQYLWPFDSTFQDLSSTFSGTAVNGAGFSPSSITGYGSSLSLSSSSSQSVLFTSPFLTLSNQSWTFEAWIYPSTLSSADNTIIGQCEVTATDKCLHLTIRNGKVYMGFYSDDLGGQTTLVTSKWYHVAYVFDNSTRNQSIYLNGILDNSQTASHSFNGNNGSLTFGTSGVNLGNNMFNGLIDQLFYINRAKTSSEILDDATLTVYFSFDGGSIYDGGPLHINGSRVGSTSVATGRVGDALQIGPSATSYFTVSGLVLLGTLNQPYSISIWIQPSASNGATIIHVSQASNGLGWCLDMLGFSSTGQLIAFSWQPGAIYVIGPVVSLNIWTHAAVTYSVTNGLRLYINGNLWNSTAPFGYSASGVANYLFLGSPFSGTTCAGAPIVNGQYSGAVDEFRLYSRELSATNVYSLANP